MWKFKFKLNLRLDLYYSFFFYTTAFNVHTYDLHRELQVNVIFISLIEENSSAIITSRYLYFPENF